MILDTLCEILCSKKQFVFFTTLADPPPLVWQKTLLFHIFFEPFPYVVYTEQINMGIFFQAGREVSPRHFQENPGFYPQADMAPPPSRGFIPPTMPPMFSGGLTEF